MILFFLYSYQSCGHAFCLSTQHPSQGLRDQSSNAMRQRGRSEQAQGQS